MNRLPGPFGVVFTDGEEGDQRSDLTARSAVSSWLGIPRTWATVRQVHGNVVIEATRPGDLGEGDAIWTELPELPLAVFTADCFGVALIAPEAVGVAHAGWRGAAGGVVTELRAEMSARGHEATSAAIGPGIGPCCFEVGVEVAGRFPSDQARTTWGSASVDLSTAIRRELEGLDVWLSGACTMHEPGLFSHRENGTLLRHASIVWVR